jgi:hypothetical protein
MDWMVKHAPLWREAHDNAGTKIAWEKLPKFAE